MRIRPCGIVGATLIGLQLFVGAGAVTAQLAPPNDRGVSIAAVHLTVTDPDEHARIWRDVFGADVVPFGSSQMVRIPGIFLMLEEGEPSAGSDGATVDHEGFLVPDYLAVKAALEPLGFPIVLENADNKQVTFEFPDGIKFEFSGVDGLSVPIAHHHIHMFLTDREALREWYAQLFGALPSTRNQFISVVFPSQGVFSGEEACRSSSGDFRCPRIDFASTGRGRATNEGRALDRIVLEVRGLERFMTTLEAEGVTVAVPVHEVASRGLKHAVIVDPMGTRVELTEGLAGR